MSYYVKNDIFAEQLVSIKNTGKVLALRLFIWIMGALLAVGLVLLGIFKNSLSFISLILAVAALYGAYYLNTRFEQEFEYSNTNGEVDIDRIINKQSRQRMAQFKCDDIFDIRPFDANAKLTAKREEKDIYFACTPGSSSYVFKIKHPKRGHYYLVLDPDGEFKESLLKTLPYILKDKLN